MLQTQTYRKDEEKEPKEKAFQDSRPFPGNSRQSWQETDTSEH